ncbi:MAG: tetratricopeptide repeat protein [Planctomycetes bacterium]|nr:tetratricopeptide repeat protein [Planctomycetota bacterium]
MEKCKRILIVMTGLAVLTMCHGCSSYADKKMAAKMKWEKVSAEAKVRVAKDLFENGRYEDARTTVEQCLASDPELADAHLLMGKLHYLDGRIAAARSSMNTAIEYDEDLDQAWYWLGEIAQHNKQPVQAMEYYDKAIRLRPANTDYIIAVVQTFAAQGQYDEALDLLDEKMALLPGNVRLKVAAADLLQRLGKTAQAISAYNGAFLLEPDNMSTAEALAYCYITDEQWTEAIGIFEKISRTVDGEKKTACLQMLALCCMNAGEYGRAVTYYDKLSVSQRDNEEIWLQMSQAALGAGAAKRASACAARALSLRPGWADAIAVQGCAQYLESDYDAAVETFGRITANRKMGGFAWLMSGRCYQQLGRKDQADWAYDKASRLNPESRLAVLLSSN